MCGSNLGENIKTTKSIERSSLQFKNKSLFHNLTCPVDLSLQPRRVNSGCLAYPSSQRARLQRSLATANSRRASPPLKPPRRAVRRHADCRRRAAPPRVRIGLHSCRPVLKIGTIAGIGTHNFFLIYEILWVTN